MKNLVTLAILAMALNLVGCGGPLLIKGLDGKNYSWSDTAKDLADEINQELGDNGVPVTFEVVKAQTKEYGYIVYKITTPGPEPIFVAVDIRGFRTGMEIEDFLGLDNIIPFITDLIGTGSSSVGFHVPGMFINLAKEGSNYRYSNNGVEMLFAQDAEGGKDLETVGARIETANVAELSERLVSNYGLSTERAQEVAKLSSSYNKLSSKRSLTETEMNKFSQELVGMNYSTAQSAMEKHFQGDSKEYNTLLQKAANKNGVDPEQVSSIMGELLLK